MKELINKKVSIVVPIFNTGDYLERCLNSIRNQTYSNLEIICVNDGSTDCSKNILDKFAKEDNRFVVINKENEGVSVARNTALKMATGDYIGFVDSDDYIATDMYEKMVEMLEKTNSDIVTCNYSFDRNGEIKRAINKSNVEEKKYTNREFIKYIYERDVYNGVAGYLWTRLVKRDVIYNSDETLKISFDGEFGGSDDIVFVANLIINSRNIYYLNLPLYYYFHRDGSIVHDDTMQLRTLSWVRAYEEIIDMFEKYNISNDELRIIKRMYVYRCGKTLEIAQRVEDIAKQQILKEKIKTNLSEYVEANIGHLDRVKWINNLMVL